MDKPLWVPDWLWRSGDELVGWILIAVLCAAVEPGLAWYQGRPPRTWGIVSFFAVAVFALWLFSRVRPRIVLPQSPLPKIETSLKIISAYYGTGSANDVSVVGFLESQVGNALSVWVGNNLIPNRPDPASGKQKRLTVEYSFGNQEVKKLVRQEYEHLVLPEDETMQAAVEKLRNRVIPVAAKPPRDLTESEFRMQQIADSEFRALTWAQRVGLREIYRQPGQFVGQMSSLLTNLGQ